MKKILVLGVALVFHAAFADTTAYETVRFTPGVEFLDVFLTTEKTRTEYRTERIRTTCYRTVYRQRCGSTRGPHQGPGHGRVCRSIPVRQAYPCTRHITRAYEVFDYYVDSEISLNFHENEDLDIRDQDFTVQVTGERASLQLQTAERDNLVVVNERLLSHRRSGDVKTQQLAFDIDFVEREKAQALQGGIQSVKLSNGVLSFTLGAGFNLADYTQRLKILRSRPLLADILLFDELLDRSQVEMINRGNRVELRVDLRQLGVSLPSRMRIILDSNYNLRGRRALNERFFNLSATSNWLFK